MKYAYLNLVLSFLYFKRIFSVSLLANPASTNPASIAV